MPGGNKPSQPHCTLARFQRSEIDVEEIKREGWHGHKILVVALSDDRLTWIDRQFIEQIGRKLFGKEPRRV